MNTKQKTELEKDLAKYNNKERFPLTLQDVTNNAERYIKAIKEGRMINSIGKVSSSGMSRTMKFVEVTKPRRGERANVLNFYVLFNFLGHTKISNSDYFRIYGCGMDMVFNTNYNNIYALHHYGFINKKDCEKLAQQTPTTI